jgi:hypothetical protein
MTNVDVIANTSSEEDDLVSAFLKERDCRNIVQWQISDEKPEIFETKKLGRGAMGAVYEGIPTFAQDRFFDRAISRTSRGHQTSARLH